MSQRNRVPRERARNPAHGTGEEAQIWIEIQEKANKLAKIEARAAELVQQIKDTEAGIDERRKREKTGK